MGTESKIHPVCNAFPEMTEAEFSALTESIRRHGLKNPIVRHEGWIVDGKHRLRACLATGVKPEFREWEAKGSLLDWCISQNLERRHLNASQRAAVAASLAPLYEQEAKARMKAGTLAPIGARVGKSSEKAAAAVGASPRSTERARRVAAASPEKIEEVRRGEKAVSAAEKEVKAEAEAETPPEDALGRPVPDKSLWPAFRATEFREICSAIQRVRKMVEALVASPLGVHMSAQSAESLLKQAYQDVKLSAPYTPCTYCKGGCKACKKARWIPKLIFDNSPEGLKA